MILTINVNTNNVNVGADTPTELFERIYSTYKNSYVHGFMIPVAGYVNYTYPKTLIFEVMKKITKVSLNKDAIPNIIHYRKLFEATITFLYYMGKYMNEYIDNYLTLKNKLKSRRTLTKLKAYIKRLEEKYSPEYSMFPLIKAYTGKFEYRNMGFI